jgi:hypothetical protein
MYGRHNSYHHIIILPAAAAEQLTATILQLPATQQLSSRNAVHLLSTVHPVSAVCPLSNHHKCCLGTHVEVSALACRDNT